MTHPLPDPALPNPDPDLCAALSADLADAGFRSESLRAAWGENADDAIGRAQRAPALHSLGAREDPLATLGRFFVLGVAQPTDLLAAALPRTGVAGLVTLGLGALDGGRVVASALIRPQSFVDDEGAGEWWIASDLDELALGAELPEDHVLGVGGASLTLAGLQLPTPAAKVLDLGTGCGIQALRARRYADSIVATDVSERALRFAALNARLNGETGIEVRRGSMFDPVAGETFERIVSNPPFVITPRGEDVPAYEYRDGGLVGDALVEAFVTGVGAHLVDGGTAQLLGNWETRDGVDGLERMRSWVAASPVPLDAWVIERERLDPVAYAELWIRDGGTTAGTAADALLTAWLDDFARRGVTQIGLGYILLRRADRGATLARYERVTQHVPEGTLGSHLADALAAHDRAVALGDDALAASVLRVASDVTEARHHRPGAADPSVIELRQGAGLARTITVDPALAALVGACDGDLSVGRLSDAIAQLLEVDAAALRTELLAEVRPLLVDGFLRFE